MNKEEDKSSESNPQFPFQQFQLKWKRKHLKFLVIYNVLIPCIMSINILLLVKEWVTKSSKTHLALISVSPVIVFSFLFFYCFKSYQIWQDYKEIIKQERFRYLYSGGNFAILSFIFFLVSLVVSCTVDEENVRNIVLYTFLGISILSGIVSTTLITVYEFCYNFDIFYSKNKEKIIEAHLKYAANFKISEDESVNENKEKGEK